MDLTTLFRKLQEHEIELKSLVEDEEGDKNKKSLTLKVKEDKISNFDEDMPYLVHKNKLSYSKISILKSSHYF